MIDPENVPPVADNELLARFVLYSEHFKQNVVKSKAFIAYKYRDLSTTRHREATIDELWQSGIDVSRQCGRPLYGRADLRAFSCRDIALSVEADPVRPQDGDVANPNHAIIAGFPEEKHEQMSFAQALAAAANDEGGFKPAPK